jgi:hypothetical protein
MDESNGICMKRLLVHFKLSLLMRIIYKCTKQYSYIQTHLHLIQTNLQASMLSKNLFTDTKLLKMPSSLELGLN